MKSITNSRFIENADTCFVAGTLVHTKNGLVPIEKIIVGDYVLSKPESGDGETSYQKVIKTFVHAEQPVLCVDVCGWTVDDGVKAELTRQLVDNSNDFPLIVTPNHLFWVVDKGWVKAEHLRYGIDVVKMANGHQHYIHDVSDVMRTDDPDIGFLVGGSYCPIKFTNPDSRAVNLKNNDIYTSYEFEDRIENEAVEWWDRNAVDVLKRTVFNIEVEHTHTFLSVKLVYGFTSNFSRKPNKNLVWDRFAAPQVIVRSIAHSIRSFCMNINEKLITLETKTGNIYGTMTFPGAGDKEKIALMISGSGPTDRDGNSRLVSGKNDCLKMLAAALAEQGVASIRYDKRGESYSYSAAPNEIDLSIERYVQDVVSWVSLLSNEYGYSDITLIGHSEGALIGMLAAQQCPVTRFISIAGSSEKGSNALRRQLNGKLPNELAKTSEHIISSLESGQTVDDVPQELNMLFRHSVQPYMISWFRYAPTDELSKLTIPCLILQGDTDIQITVNDSIALHHANKQSELKILSGMNHILKSVPPDFEQQIASYSDPDIPIVSEVISVISSFLSHSKTDLTKN